MRKVKRYVPEKVLDWINKSDFKNKDHLVVICDMIIRISVFRGIKKTDWGECDYSNGFTDIPNSYFTNIISNKISFKEAMSHLQNSQIVLCDGFYCKGSKSLGYKFPDDMVSKVKTYIISKDLISKKIAKNRNKRNNSVPDWLKSSKNHFINNFKINYNGAISYINENYDRISEKLERSDTSGRLKLINQYNSHYISVSCINDGDLFFRRNDTNGRIDTNLTNLKKELRQFIDYPRPLYQIDIVNSQPFFLGCLIQICMNGHGSWGPSPTLSNINSLLNALNISKNSKPLNISSVTQYYLLCSTFLNEKSLKPFMDGVCRGFVYDRIIEVYKMYKNVELTRKQAKLKVFQVVYSDVKSFKLEKSLISKIYPDVMKFLDDIKKMDYKMVSRILQSMESSFSIDSILPLFEIDNINSFTIHDSWIMEHSDIAAATSIIENEFISLYGIKPQLEITKI